MLMGRKYSDVQSDDKKNKWIKGSEKTCAAQKSAHVFVVEHSKNPCTHCDMGERMSNSGAAHSLGVISRQGDAR